MLKMWKKMKGFFFLSLFFYLFLSQKLVFIHIDCLQTFAGGDRNVCDQRVQFVG